MSFDTLVLFGWLVFFIVFYNRFRDPRLYFIVNLFGSWLFLPQSIYDLPILPDLTKHTAFGLSAIISVILFERRARFVYIFNKFDLPAIVICLAPIITSLDNGLGIWDGLSASVGACLTWGVPYYIGRRFFHNFDDIKYLLVGFLSAVVMYLPFIWFEVFMSPNLHKLFYGYNQNDWVENIRYGGWRPKIFMQHGLMVALFVSLSLMAVSALHLVKKNIRIFKIKLSVIDKLILITIVACKSGNGILFLFLGLIARVILRARIAHVLIIAIIVTIPAYLYVRVTGALEWQHIITNVEIVSDKSRAGSLRIRMEQEDLFIDRAKDKWLFGWGGWGRAFPIDKYGMRTTRGVDSLWIIVYSEHGLVSLISLCWMMLGAPFLINRRSFLTYLERSQQMSLQFVSLILVFFMVDCLANAMVSPFYPLLGGALMGVFITLRRLPGKPIIQ